MCDYFEGTKLISHEFYKYNDIELATKLLPIQFFMHMKHDLFLYLLKVIQKYLVVTSQCCHYRLLYRFMKALVLIAPSKGYMVVTWAIW